MNVHPVDKFDWQKLVRETEGIPQVTKLVAFVISTYANRDGTSCHPGTERLAREAGLSDRRLRDHLVVLRDDLRLICRTAHGGGRGRRLADVYQLCVPDNLPTLIEESAAKHRTSKRPTYRAETPDTQTSDVSTETPDVDANTPDVGEETPDVEPNTPDTQTSAHQAPTPAIDQGALSSCGESIAEPAAPSPNDNRDEVYESARTALASLAPTVYEDLLAKAKSEGASETRDMVCRAADSLAAAS